MKKQTINSILTQNTSTVSGCDVQVDDLLQNNPLTPINVPARLFT